VASYYVIRARQNASWALFERLEEQFRDLLDDQAQSGDLLPLARQLLVRSLASSSAAVGSTPSFTMSAIPAPPAGSASRSAPRDRVRTASTLRSPLRGGTGTAARPAASARRSSHAYSLR
jgi:hypothetical protein